MENKFFQLWDKALNANPFLYLDMGYHKHCGYTLAISAETSSTDRWEKAFFKREDHSRHELFARACSALEKYVNEKLGQGKTDQQKTFHYYCSENHYLGQFAEPPYVIYCERCDLSYLSDEWEVVEA